MSYEATSVKFDHLKTPYKNPAWKQYRGIRAVGWETASLSDNKILYAALDVAMPKVIVY